ncbi:MAG: PilW family protein [Vicinamibacterales bacterium]
MSQRGFTLIELLIACLLLTMVTAAVAGIAGPARNSLERTLGAGDLTAGGRATLERLLFDLREAGSGSAIGDRAVDYADVVPFVVPHADLDDLTAATPGQAITVTRIGLTAPQGTLLDDIAAGSDTLQLHTTARCANGGVACGLQLGMNVVVFDASRASTSSIRTVGAGGLVQLAGGLPVGFAAGAVVAAVTTVTYGLRTNADGSRRLVRSAPGGAEQPVLQNVVGFEVRIDGHAVAPMPSAVDGWPATYGPGAPPAGQDDPRDAWAAGENCTVTRDSGGVAAPRLATFAPAEEPLQMTTAMLLDGPWCADAVDAARFDADLLRIRGIDLRLRVEAASAALRGPVPRLFHRPGTEQNAGRWVPDIELRTRIALRNAGQ